MSTTPFPPQEIIPHVIAHKVIVAARTSLGLYGTTFHTPQERWSYGAEGMHKCTYCVHFENYYLCVRIIFRNFAY